MEGLNCNNGLVVLCAFCLAKFANAADIVGTWKTIDDKTGYVLAHVKIEQLADKSYIGAIIEQFTYPGQEMILLCQKCEAPNTDKKIKGLQIISKLVQDPKREDSYVHGKVLDPIVGKIYNLKIKATPDGRKLRVSGYIGTSMIGRSQTWLRKE